MVSTVHRAIRSLIRLHDSQTRSTWSLAQNQKSWLTCFNHSKIGRTLQWKKALVAAILGNFSPWNGCLDYVWKLWVDAMKVCLLNPFQPGSKHLHKHWPKGSLSMVHHGASCRDFHEKSWEWVQSVSGCCGFNGFRCPISKCQLDELANRMFEYHLRKAEPLAIAYPVQYIWSSSVLPVFFPGGSVRFLKNTIFQKSSRQWVRVLGHDMGPGIKYHTKRGPDFFPESFLTYSDRKSISVCCDWGGVDLSVCVCKASGNQSWMTLITGN